MTRRIFILIIVAICNCLSLLAKRTEITIIVANDVHASIDKIPMLATLLDSIRSVNSNVLLFSAGDNRTGNPVNDKYPQPNYPMTFLMNQLGFNLSAIGNHEMDDGPEAFRTTINNSNFHYICANMHTPDSLRIFVDPYRIIEVDGVRIGVLGLIQINETGTPDIHPKNLNQVSFTMPKTEVEHYGPWLKQSTDVLLLLSHLGFDDDVAMSEFAPYFDVIIGAHSHTAVKENYMKNGVLITQNDSKLKTVSEIKLVVEDGHVIEKTSKVHNVAKHKADENIKRTVDFFNDNETFKTVVATTAHKFPNIQTLGSLICDAAKDFAATDFALQNGGGVRIDSLPAGPITLRDVYALDPFSNELYTLKITGAQLLQLLANAYIMDKYLPCFTAGFNYRLTTKKQSDGKIVVEKVEAWLPDGKKLNTKRIYSIVMNSYMVSMFKYGNPLEIKSTYTVSASVLIDYLKQKQHIEGPAEDRVVVVNQ
ncbi:MAG: bifunctional UDP-sugar hydrolase/5'-nucleotidase [Bacteroidales bacterium]|nr:bifunctional UDP-sugar hydrolase/5'-nucleotidase [Bacteroidales bacterium]